MMPPEMITAAFKMIGVLVVIVGGLLAFNVYSRRVFKGGGGSTGSRAVQVLDSTPIGLKKSVTLIQTPGAVLVLGLTQDRITLLDRMDIQDFEAHSLAHPPQGKATFKDHLRKLSGSWQRTHQGAPLAESTEGNT